MIIFWLSTYQPISNCFGLKIHKSTLDKIVKSLAISTVIWECRLSLYLSTALPVIKCIEPYLVKFLVLAEPTFARITIKRPIFIYFFVLLLKLHTNLLSLSFFSIQLTKLLSHFFSLRLFFWFLDHFKQFPGFLPLVSQFTELVNSSCVILDCYFILFKLFFLFCSSRYNLIDFSGNCVSIFS